MAAGKRVGWVGGKTYKRDHFPVIRMRRPPDFTEYDYGVSYEDAETDFSANDPGYQTGDGNSYPFGWGIRDIMRNAFRVRAWTLSATMGYKHAETSDGGLTYHWSSELIATASFDFVIHRDVDGHYGTGSVPPNEAALVAIPAASEEEPAFAIIFADGSTATDRISVSNVVVSGVGSATLFLGLVMDYWGIRDTSGDDPEDHWPFLAVNGGMGNARSDYLLELAANRDIGTLTMFSNTSTIKDIPFPTDPESSVDQYQTSMNVSIQPKSYWPYANSAGEQVYNETTGAQLVDPFS